MKWMLSKKKMAAKIPLKIKWSGVNTAENVGQRTMGNAPNHTLKIVFYKKKYAIPPLKKAYGQVIFSYIRTKFKIIVKLPKCYK